MYLEFKEIAADARIWIYQSDRKFNQEELRWVKGHLKDFCEQWNTHGALMPSSYEIKFDQVIILSVDESNLGASGCSIDSSVKVLREIEQKYGVSLIDQGKVCFLASQDALEVSSVFGIKLIVQSGLINRDTLVLNPLVKKKGDLENNWLIPAKESWLMKYFPN